MSASLGNTSIPGIKIEAPNGSSQTFPVEYDIVLVGSANENNIILRDPAIAADHLQIDFEPEYVVATDLQSDTGTIIGITQLEPNQPTIWPEEQTLYVGPFKLTLTQVSIGEIAPLPTTSADTIPEPLQPESPSGATLYSQITDIIIEAGSPHRSGAADVPYVVVNNSNETDRFSLQISGIPQDWLGSLPQVMLQPGSQADIVVRYRIPPLSPNSLGSYPIEIVAYSEHGDYRSQPLQSTLTITPSTEAADSSLMMPSPSDAIEVTAKGAAESDDAELPNSLSIGDIAAGNIQGQADSEEHRENIGTDAADREDEWEATPRADEWISSAGDTHETDSDIDANAVSSEAQSYSPDVSTWDESSLVHQGVESSLPEEVEIDHRDSSDLTELSIRQFKQDGTSDNFGISKDVVVIGSGDDDDIRFEDEVGVVPRHINLYVDEDDQVYIVPRHETPGVFIGRTKAPEGKRTRWDADKIMQIGPSLRLGLEKSSTAALVVELYPNGPQDWTIGSGRIERTSYIVANLGKRTDHFRLNIQGVPSEWVEISESVELSPGSKGDLSVQFMVPESATAPAGERMVQVQAVGVTYGNESNSLPASLKVLPIQGFRTSLEPHEANLAESMRLIVENQGNEVQGYQVTWHDTKDALNFTPEYHDFVLGPGEMDSVSFSADYQAGRPFFGNRKYPFKATITPEAGERVVKEGQLTGFGCLPLWIFLLPLLCFICAALPIVAQSRLNLGIDLPGIDLPTLELPGFLSDLLGDNTAGPLPGDVETSNENAIPNAEQAIANATKNASAYATAAAEVTAAADLVFAATNSWLELDDDADGLSNREEQEVGSRIDKRDTDEDGIVDGEEVNKWQTNPLSKDSDSDGIDDLDEIRRSLDPRNPDTDGDGVLDGRDPAPGQAPTPTPDATKTAVAIQRATAQAGCYVDTGFDTLNLRAGPGEAYNPPLVKLPNGAWLQPLAYQYPGNPQGEWIEVAVRGTEWRGWVSREWIKCNIDITQLPAGQVPPTATPTLLPTATLVATVTVSTEVPTETATPEPTSTSTSVPPLVEPAPSETDTPMSPIVTPESTDEGDEDSNSGTAPEPTQPPDVDLADIEDIYGVLKLADLATDKTIYGSGDQILLTYALQNSSDVQIKVPQPEAGAQPLVGTRQHWIERLGDNSNIPSLSEENKSDNRYRFRNEIIQATILLPENPIITQQTLDTTDFPSGDYLITVEYRTLNGDLLDSAAVAFVIE